MKKWEIRPTPSADDPDRHVLLLQGGPSDVSALLKKFGALMGRPSPAKAKGFNLSLVLHRLKPAARAKLEAWLTPAAPKPILTPVLAPPSPEPVVRASPVPASVPLPAGALAEASPAVDLRPNWTLETLLVGAYNRFAHAAAMSVVSSPGTMYNPLFLFGVPGTGKSHMLNAIGSALSKGLGATVLLSTSGPRLSHAVNAALARKALDEVDLRVAHSKALLVDDIHLMAISDQNKDVLAKTFKSFFDRKLQVVITSLYPPRSLGALEEALKFSFSKGWSVDLKTPSPAVQKEVIGASAERARLRLSAEELTLLHERLAQRGYSDLAVWLKRVSVFKTAREASGQDVILADVLRLIHEPMLAEGGEPAKIAASTFQTPAAPPNAEPIAVIVPQGQDGLGAFAAGMFYDVGLKNGFTQIYRHASWETYDPMTPFGVPFLIGEMCHRAGVARALIVGPAPDSPLGPRSAEFAHATRRILESLGVESAFIPYDGLQLDAHYINAHLDLTRVPAS